jgi:hypothetical protein
MGKNFNLGALYAEGLKTKELRQLYAAQLSEKYDLREWDEYAEAGMCQLVKDALVSGDFLALGYSQEAGEPITAIPPSRWRFLDLDLYLGEARRSGAEDLVFSDIRCVPKDRLPNDLLAELSDPHRLEPSEATSDTQGSPLAFSKFGAGHFEGSTNCVSSSNASPILLELASFATLVSKSAHDLHDRKSSARSFLMSTIRFSGYSERGMVSESPRSVRLKLKNFRSI